MPVSNFAQNIRERIDSGYIIEAGALLTAHKEKLSNEELAQFTEEIDTRRKKADQYMEEAAAAESHGSLLDAFELVHAAAKSAADYPGLHKRLSDLQDAITLTGLVKNRSIRRNAERLAAGRVKRPSGRKKWFFAMVLILGLAGLLLPRYFILPVTVPQADNLLEQEQKADQLTGAGQSEASLADVTPKEPVTETPRKLDAAPHRSQASAAGEQDGIKQEQQVHQPHHAEQTDATPALRTTADKPALPATPPEPDTSPPNTLSPAETTQADTHPPDPAVEAPAPVQQVQPRFYIVKKDDTLSQIAVDLFCNGQAAEDLQRINRSRISDPDEIYPGMVILLEDPEISIENRCE